MLHNLRPYTININTRKGATSFDILQSYYYARLLDLELLKAGPSWAQELQQATDVAESNFAAVDWTLVREDIASKGFSLDYIYLDSKKFRYDVGDVESISE